MDCVQALSQLERRTVTKFAKFVNVEGSKAQCPGWLVRSLARCVFVRWLPLKDEINDLMPTNEDFGAVND
jgi:hypothetical protein